MDLRNYLILIFSIFIVFIAGHIILWLSRLRNPSNKHFKLFGKLLTGTIAVVFLYSIILTNGKTINVLFIFIAFLSWYLLKKENLFLREAGAFPYKINKQDLLISCETLIIATLWYIWTDHYYWNSPYTLTHKDFIFYAKVAEYLNLTHYENYFHVVNLFDDKYHGCSPYHYFEIWLTAAYSGIFNVLELISYLKLTMTLLLTIASVGIIALFKNYFNHNYFNLFIPVLLFTQGIFITNFLTEIDAFLLNPVIYPKYLSVYLMLIASLLFYLKRKNIFFIPLLCIPVMSISCASGIFSGLVLFAVFSLIFKNKIISKETSLLIILSVLLLFGLITAFYALFGIEEKNVLDTMNLAYILNNFHTSINIYGVTTLQLLYLNFIYIGISVAAYFFMKVRFSAVIKEWFILTILVYVASLAAWALLFQMRHSLQIFQNISIPFINIMIIFLLIYLAGELKRKKSFFYPVLLILIFINCGVVLSKNYKNNPVFNTYNKTYSNTYISKIDGIVKGEPINPTGVFFFDKGEYDDWSGRTESNFYTLGDYLKLLKPYYNAVSLTVFDVPLGAVSSPKYRSNLQLLQSSIFYHFADSLKNANRFITIEDAQVSFIKTNKINYGIASGMAKLSPQLQSMIGEQIIDEATGERFMIFKY